MAAQGGPPTERVAVTRLSITDFRNYEALDHRFGAPSVVLYGPNGAGKTNLLEAISLLGPGRGLRRAVFSELGRTGGDGGWAVAAEGLGPLGTVRLGTGLVVSAQSPAEAASRQCRVDGMNVKSAGAFADHLRMTWLTPAQDRLFTGPASDRRRFIDRLVGTIVPAHRRVVQAFEQAMKERNRLLAQAGEDPAWLAALEAQMAEAGVAVAAGRADAVSRLAQHLGARAHASAFPPAHVTIEGGLEEQLKDLAAVDVEDKYASDLKAARPRDRAAGRTLDGPHRSDLVVAHGVTGAPAGQCSTGEQKALLIAIILAEARLIMADFGGFPPILLLDEVAAHLDARRREALFTEIDALGAQTWLTGTDRSLFSAYEARATFVAVDSGQISVESDSTGQKNPEIWRESPPEDGSGLA